MNFLHSRLSVLTLMLIPLTSTIADDATGIAFFERKVRPILVESCYDCHSVQSGKSKGGLLVDSRDGLLNGGDLGQAIVPGKPEESLLYKAVTYTDDDLEMPPKKQLSEDEIEILRKWIIKGAPDPRRNKGVGSPKEKGIDFEEAKKHWAFRPLKKPSVPEVEDSSWPIHEIDQFILSRLEQKKIQPTIQADAVTLMRRVYYDLTGLPPTPLQQDKFISEAEKDFDSAYESLVSELLDSPAFGERWGRHWLDVVHYGETFSKPRNFVNPQMWKYRDYVIAAYNADKPFDQFLTEQLAGDLLPAKDLVQRREQMVATGMLLTGQRAYTGGGKSPEAMEYLADDIDDQLNLIGHAVLGLSIACSRCHDHKFDPIPTEDYYALAGILRSTSSYNNKISPSPHPEHKGGPGATASIRFVAMPSEIAELETIGAKHTKAEHLRTVLRRHERDIQRRLQLEKERNVDYQHEIKAIRKKVQVVRSNLSKLEAELGEPVKAERVAAVADYPTPVAQPLFIKGDPANLGENVKRGFLQLFPIAGEELAIPDDQSGRLQLARWLISPENPLVARVYANRIWQHVFGVGIVESVDNFGLTGQAPSHGQLLDYLALWFQENGWSTKKLVRMLVLSRTYRLASTPHDAGMASDPGARLRWRMMPRQLDAESIRDTVLMASQRLQAGSPGPSEAARNGFHAVGAVPVSYDIPHRTVYLSILRDAVPHQLEVFNFPDPSFISGTRATNSTPTQALFMMNSEFITKASLDTARHLLKCKSIPRKRIELAIRLILGRPGTPEEINFAEGYMQEAIAKDTDQSSVWAALCQALFSLTDFRYIR